MLAIFVGIEPYFPFFLYQVEQYVFQEVTLALAAAAAFAAFWATAAPFCGEAPPIAAGGRASRYSFL